MSCFAFVDVAFGARLTVLTSVGSPASEKIIAPPKENIGRPKKAKKTTVKPKTVAVTV